MSAIQVKNISLLQNPAAFTSKYEFEIRFECVEEIEGELNWALVYVGSSESSSHDQVLEDVEVGPVALGMNEFVLEADAPDVSQIPPESVVGITALLLTCSYKEQEFLRVGWYVNTDYKEQELRENPPQTPQVHKLVRDVLQNDPRVTTKTIQWSGNPPSMAPQQPAGDLMAMD
eukprot:NODE_5598_length_688_cov_9.467023_g5575_i0.p1 GENE.NODE_5598_length_688_cov_9.467023_g5575_i0~~NODE_5598_length_688_cov_9.467023_g5575_i0.p1  ORF type:complete len:174 (+),score=33.24 NODE_5598_length_688_cov_9.467023_g5575_i0:57-578(+)